MKAYKPEKLVAISRYGKYFPTLPAEIRREVYSRMRVLLEGEKRWCDKGNYKHIAQILTSVALYEVLQRHGRTEEEAFGIVSAEMWKQLTPGDVSEAGAAPLVHAGDEKDIALRLPARLRRGLEIRLASEGGPEGPLSLRVPGMPVQAHF